MSVLQDQQNIAVMNTFRDYINSDLLTTGLDIVCIGDSIFEGLYCGEDYYYDNWAYKLREKLQAKFNPAGIGGLGYMPFSAGFYETTRVVWNTRFPNTIPANLILWDATGGVIHSWESDWAYGMWTRETASRGVYMEGVTDAKLKWDFTGYTTTDLQLITMRYPGFDVKAWLDVNSTNAYVNFLAGDICHAEITIPETVEPDLSVPADYGGYSYGYHAPKLSLPSATADVTVQLGNDATNNNHLVASGIVHYNGDYAKGIRLHNFATSGNWAFPESARLQQNVTKWCTQAGGATNARMFICNLITNDYIYQENQIAYNVWHAANPDAQPSDPGYMYNPGLTLPIDPTYYALVMDNIIAANTDPVLLWVIPPKPYFGGTTETYTYQQYVDMIYTLASTRPEVAILNMWDAVGDVERTALTNGWGDIDLTHFTQLWQVALADAIGEMIMLPGTAYCFNTKNQTWTYFDNFPAGIPVNLKHLGTDLHIEDNNIYKMFNGYNDDGNAMTIRVTTGRHTTPDTQHYKSLDCAEIYSDGETGIDYSYPEKSVLIFDGVNDISTTMVSPGGSSPLQKIKTAFSQCKNYSLRLIATIAGDNTVSHAIQSIKWKINVRGLIK